MSAIDGKKAKIIDLLKEVDKRKSRKAANEKLALSIVGNNNVQANGDIYINKRETVRKEFTPGPEHITASQAHKLQRLVEKAVSYEEAAGVYAGNRQKLFAKWWKIVQNQYDVATYREIPAHLGESAITWMTQKVAILRPKTRRTDKSLWRNEHYSAIYARSHELGISKGEIYAIVLERLGVQVLSLTKLSDQNLKKLYNIIMSMRK
jgi:hypothetical protein